jgi:hypothetical protein
VATAVVRNTDTARVLTFGEDEAEEDLDADDEDYVGEDEPDDGESLGSHDTVESPEAKKEATKVAKGRGGGRVPEQLRFGTPVGCVLALTPFIVLFRDTSLFDAGRGNGNLMNTVAFLSEKFNLNIVCDGCDLYNGDEAYRNDIFELVKNRELFLQNCNWIISNPPFSKMSKWFPTLCELCVPAIIMMRCDSLSAKFFREAVKNYPFFVLTFPRFEFETNNAFVPIEGVCWVVIHPLPEMLNIVMQMEPHGNPTMGFLQHPSFYENQITMEELQQLKQSLDDYSPDNSIPRPVVQSLDGSDLFNANTDT